VSKLFSALFFLIFTSSLATGGVAPNPFLRPGSDKLPIPEPPPVKPKPQVNPELLKEVEFRGYFLLNGIPHFCIFNKKSNFGEWIRLSEETYENFEAESFDLKSETLTLVFNGQSFELKLQDSKNSPGSGTGIIKPSVPNLPKSTAGKSSNTPKVMPPKPISKPKLPDWLVQRSKQNQADTPFVRSTGVTGQSSVRNRPVLPGMIPTSSSSNSRNSNGFPSPAANPNFSAPSNNPISMNNIPSTSPSLGNVPSTAQLSSDFSNGVNAQDSTQNDEIDLSSLPPPPPPPNILPPSGPPDIIPSRDD